MKTFTDVQICDLAESGKLKNLLDREGALLMVRGDEVVCRVERMGPIVPPAAFDFSLFTPDPKAATITRPECDGD